MSRNIKLYKDCILYTKKRIDVIMKEDKQLGRNLTKLTSLLDRYNTSLLLVEGYERRVFNDILNQKNLYSFIIDETVLLFKNTMESDDAFINLANHIAYCQSAINKTNSAISTNSLENMPEINTAVQLLYDNPWLVYIILVIDSLQY